MNFTTLNKSLSNSLYRAMNETNFYGARVQLYIGNDGKLHEAMHLRFYATDNRIYVWVHLNVGDHYGSGRGYASGYGNDKESAAFASALEDAGVTDIPYISGIGMRAAMDDHVVPALCEALGIAREDMYEVQSYA